QGVLLREVPPNRQAGHCSLVGGSRRLIESTARAVADCHSVGPAERLQVVDPPIAPLGVEENPFDLTGTRTDRLLDRGEARKDHACAVSSTTAIAARPSLRPVKPSPLELVPRTLTASASVPRISAIRFRIAGT